MVNTARMEARCTKLCEKMAVENEQGYISISYQSGVQS